MERAAAGESFVITRHGKPFASLLPPPYEQQRVIPLPLTKEILR
jgi:antitoxin (DNA-binding transcriptional repressor) of toxin-antitoxin stability system